MRLVKMSMVYGRERVVTEPDAPIGVTGEDDGLGDVNLSNVAEIQFRDLTQEMYLDAEQVRNFYPRKAPRTGTRILFRSGSAVAVSEDLETVRALVEATAA